MSKTGDEGSGTANGAQIDDLLADRGAKAETHKFSKKPVNGKPRRLNKPPKKPYKDSLLFPHASGQWAKKIKGKTYYFGPWAGPQGSLDKHLARKDDLFVGRTPRAVTGDGCTVQELVNRFLASKEQLGESGEPAERTLDDCYRDCKKVVGVFGPHRTAGPIGRPAARVGGQIDCPWFTCSNPRQHLIMPY